MREPLQHHSQEYYQWKLIKKLRMIDIRDFYCQLQRYKMKSMNQSREQIIEVNFENSKTRIIPSQIVKKKQGSDSGKATQDTKRVGGSTIWFVVIVICTFGVPFANLFLFQFQPVSLARGAIDPANLSINNIGRSTDYAMFYVAMAIYIVITACFIVYSLYFTNMMERIKIHFLLDNIMVCMLGADVSYAALHIVNFTASYSSDEYYFIEATYDVSAQDIVVIIFYCITNLCFAGVFRLLMKYVNWEPYKVVIFKAAIVISSLAYIAVGFAYLAGKTELSGAVEDYKKAVTAYIQDDLIANAAGGDMGTVIDEMTYLQRGVSSLANTVNGINTFVILYVFTNFAFIYQILCKITDFDQTGDLKTGYELKQLEN